MSGTRVGAPGQIHVDAFNAAFLRLASGVAARRKSDAEIARLAKRIIVIARTMPLMFINILGPKLAARGKQIYAMQSGDYAFLRSEGLASLMGDIDRIKAEAGPDGALIAAALPKLSDEIASLPAGIRDEFVQHIADMLDSYIDWAS